MEHRTSPTNPRLDLLRREVEEKVLNPFRSHGWSAEIVLDVEHHDCVEIAANRDDVATRIAVLYSSEISNSRYSDLSNRVDRIFLRGQSHRLDAFPGHGTVSVDSLDNFSGFSLT